MAMIRTRVAPSPTGFFHIGTAYASLFNLAFARKNKGKFVLRIEDTDIERNVPGVEEKIIQGMRWLGLNYDEGPEAGGKYGPYRQSERMEIYKQYAARLKKSKMVYEKEGALWLKAPDKGETFWEDIVRGRVAWKNSEINDFIIVRSSGIPLYNFVVVVDDIEMKISHVIRAEDHISNTPRQLLIYRALGAGPPRFAHFPLLRNPDKSKISKRKNPVALDWYKEQGFLPEALVNFLSLLGWSHPKEKEIFDLDEFIENFSLERIKTSQPVFDLEKLKWMNGKYIRESQMPQFKCQKLMPYLIEYNAELAKKIEILEAEKFDKILKLVKERLETLGQFAELTEYFFEMPGWDCFKGLTDAGNEKMRKIIENEIKGIESQGGFDGEGHEARSRAMAEKLGIKAGEVFMVLREAVTGRTTTPPLFEVMRVLGKEETVLRLKAVLEMLKE